MRAMSPEEAENLATFCWSILLEYFFTFLLTETAPGCKPVLVSVTIAAILMINPQDGVALHLAKICAKEQYSNPMNLYLRFTFKKTFSAIFNSTLNRICLTVISICLILTFAAFSNKYWFEIETFLYGLVPKYILL